MAGTPEAYALTGQFAKAWIGKDALDPLAERPPESVTLNGLVAQGLLTRAPATAPRIAADTPSGRSSREEPR